MAVLGERQKRGKELGQSTARSVYFDRARSNLAVTGSGEAHGRTLSPAHQAPNASLFTWGTAARPLTTTPDAVLGPDNYL